MLRISFLFLLIIICQSAFAQKIYENYELPELIPYSSKNKFGYCNSKKEMMIQTRFDFAYPFHSECSISHSPDISVQKFGTNEYATVIIKDEKYRIDKKGKIVCSYKSAGMCDMGMLNSPYSIFEEGGLKGVKRVYQVVIPTKYEEVHFLSWASPGLPVIAKLNGKFGLIDDKNTLVNFDYEAIEYALDFPSDDCPLLLVEKEKKKFYVDFAGNEYVGK